MSNNNVDLDINSYNFFELLNIYHLSMVSLFSGFLECVREGNLARTARAAGKKIDMFLVSVLTYRVFPLQNVSPAQFQPHRLGSVLRPL